MKYLLLISLLLVLASCGQFRQGTALEFENIEMDSPQWSPAGGHYYEEKTPALFVLKPDDRAVLAPFVEPNAPFLNGVFSDQILITVFEGIKHPSESEGGIRIEAIYLDNEHLYIHTKFITSQEDQFSFGGAFSRYMIVAINEKDLKNIPLHTAHLIDADTQTELLTTTIDLAP